MQPARFRRDRGFALVVAASAYLGATMRAPAATLTSSYMTGAAPIAIAAGALVFGIAAAVFVERWRRDGRKATARAETRLRKLRADLDAAQAILEGMPELTIRWRDAHAAPSVFGPLSIVYPAVTGNPDLLDFRSWLAFTDVAHLSDKLSGLRGRGEAFDLSLVTRDQRLMRITGRMIGESAVMRIRPAHDPAPPLSALSKAHRAGQRGQQALFAMLPLPAFTRNTEGLLTYANPAYRALTGTAHSADLPPDLFDARAVKAQLGRLEDADSAVIANAFERDGVYDLYAYRLGDGFGFYLRRQSSDETPTGAADEELAHIGGVINALHSPIAIFDGRSQLVQANDAYLGLWGLDRSWLKPGMSEQTILDRLRTLGVLPAEVDYRAWRSEHLKSYTLHKSRETLWHLPDGRHINVVAVPAAASGGVIYVFEDMTSRFDLESRFNTLIKVQGETLNALSEAVAVFGTNGRLTLSNPRLSSLWKLPMNLIAKSPHIDEIGEACAEVMPEDGLGIWRDLKQSIIDLNPTRADRSGRINRADGRLINYATIRLPDGQTLLTFSDITESANYQRVLKERNDALVNADRLKDAFVQNVSYELRSPLTNIIGFAEILASGGAGELSDKQKSYADYIRSSSATLGVLIDNILDLATVDAGVIELDLGIQDIPALVERARAGLAAAFSDKGNQVPINLRVEIDPDLPEFVADGTRIVQVLYNLLANAARFSEPGSEIRLSVTGRGNDRIVMTVEDEGAGIPQDVRATLFQRFEGKAVAGRQRGPGLGLSIVRAFVNLHGGTVAIEDRKPRGTRVVVNLPANAETATQAAQ